MSGFDDFKALFEAPGAKQTKHRGHLKVGAAVEGTVVHFSGDSVFVDIGTPVEARIMKEELLDKSGQLKVSLGDRIAGTITNAEPDALLLTTVLGRGGHLESAQLKLAFESKIPISGQVSKVVKGGVEVDLSGTRAFCPASQLDVNRITDLDPFVGQKFEFLILEYRDNGRSIIVSRRSLLEVELKKNQSALLESLSVGSEVAGVVASTNKHGALIELSGSLVAFAHISELSSRRLERAEDAVTVGDKVTARILSVEQTPRGPNVRVSLKDDKTAAGPAAKEDPHEVLKGKVVRAIAGGILVETARGEGFVPLRELDLAPGADHRRSYAVGREMDVVMVRRDGGGRISYSARAVAGVQESNNYREFSATQTAAPAAVEGLGTFGALLRQKFDLPAPVPSAKPAPAAAQAPATAPAPNATPAQPTQAALNAPRERSEALPPVQARPQVSNPQPRVESAEDRAELEARGIVRRRK
ncbi:MAG: S1 RNA-binding domain-containing protein [Polyangiaceae bacterium]|nr:S1 RNA-binding domain-containing protein [Polyangiaceae bacterium]